MGRARRGGEGGISLECARRGGIVRFKSREIAELDEGDGATDVEGAINGWVPCYDGGQPVQEALDAAFDALDNLPPALRKASIMDGFCYLISPLRSAGRLPQSALAPGPCGTRFLTMGCSLSSQRRLRSWIVLRAHHYRDGARGPNSTKTRAPSRCMARTCLTHCTDETMCLERVATESLPEEP